MKRKILFIFVIQLFSNLFASEFEKNFEKKYWVREYYNEVIQRKDRDVFLQYVPNFKENPSTFYYHLDEELYWYEELERIGDNCEISYSDYAESNYLFLLRSTFNIISTDNNKENYFIISTEKKEITPLFVNEQLKEGCDWSLLQNQTVDKFYIKFDGDYMYIYIGDGKQLLVTYCAFDEQEYNTFIEAVKYNDFNKLKYSYPRHADGSCDYEKGNTSVASSSSATNVSINRTMSVMENLKLRSAEATSSTVLNVMTAGTKVKVLELGKAETIDGINSNWVKVEVISGKDRDGNKLKSGMTGWCYGGYLE